MIKDSRYYYGIGIECIDKCNFSEAITYLLKSLELDKHFKTYERLSYCYKNVGKNEESNECIRKAFEMNNNNDKVAIEYSQLLLEEKDYVKVTLLINEVLRRNPTYGPAKKIIEELKNYNK